MLIISGYTELEQNFCSDGNVSFPRQMCTSWTLKYTQQWFYVLVFGCEGVVFFEGKTQIEDVWEQTVGEINWT
jgi:hypothetical protein